jgi:hypothetical protein
MNGMARALLQRDSAIVDLEMSPEATLETDAEGPFYDAEAETYMDAFASAERHVIGGTEKAQAEGYIPVATWTSSAQSRNGNLASVIGEAGPTQDGLPNPLMGFGVGAWIMHPFNDPVTSEVMYDQEATTFGEFDPITGDQDANLQNSFIMTLNGMRENGVTNDAVGAFGGIKNAYSEVIMPNYYPDPITGDYTVDAEASLSPSDITAIEWLEGNNPNPLPGHYFPFEMTPTIDVDAVSRDISLTLEKEKSVPEVM